MFPHCEEVSKDRGSWSMFPSAADSSVGLLYCVVRQLLMILGCTTNFILFEIYGHVIPHLKAHNLYTVYGKPVTIA